jgi:hypothetical protein
MGPTGSGEAAVDQAVVDEHVRHAEQRNPEALWEQQVSQTHTMHACKDEWSPAGLDLPLVTGRFTAVTGLDRLRYRPVTNR